MMGEAGAWLAVLQLPLCPRNPNVPLHGLEWDGKLNFFAVQNKTVMETAKIRVCDYGFGVTDLF